MGNLQLPKRKPWLVSVGVPHSACSERTNMDHTYTHATHLEQSTYTHASQSLRRPVGWNYAPPPKHQPYLQSFDVGFRSSCVHGRSARHRYNTVGKTRGYFNCQRPCRLKQPRVRSQGDVGVAVCVQEHPPLSHLLLSEPVRATSVIANTGAYTSHHTTKLTMAYLRYVVSHAEPSLEEKRAYRLPQ